MDGQDISANLAAQVSEAAARQQALRIEGRGSKAFYGNPVDGETLCVAEHAGIVCYEPTELVLTARAGTRIADIEAALAANGQMLTFEPPSFAGEASIGGAVAAGLAGPRRPWGGAPRDQLLGVKLLDGRGRILSFGGEVMKNVAGYDFARLMAGALGTLGVLLEVSIKVLPAPAVERSLQLQMSRDAAVELMRKLARLPAPLSGACQIGDDLHLRLSGNASSVQAWQQQIGGESSDDLSLWSALRNHELPFFEPHRPLWRLSLPPASPRLECEHEVLTDWAGGQRWVYSETNATELRQQVAAQSGHATLFRYAAGNTSVFHPLDTVRERLQRGLKAKFDPANILNPGRQYLSI